MEFAKSIHAPMPGQPDRAQTVVMLFLFGGRYRLYVRTAIGVVFLVAGLALHLTALLLVGVALAVWGAASFVAGRGSR